MMDKPFKLFSFGVLISCIMPTIALSANSIETSISQPKALQDAMDIKSPSANEVKKQLEKMSLSVRLNAVLDQAYVIGSQSGLYWRGTELQNSVSKESRNLDIIWDFNALMLENGRIMPPVIGDLRHSQEIKKSKRVYIGRDLIIIRGARFVQHAPNWRIYLMASQFTKPDLESINPILYPTNDERAAWKAKILEGWKDGVHQAELIMMDNLHRLSRDFTGMVRYHVLLAMGMVTPPFVVEQRDDVVGTGTHMSIDRRTQTITIKPTFNMNSERWVAVPAIKDAFHD